MEHWAHRLYPKLPFDDVMKRISVLGKKMAVQSYVKKLRLDMVHTLNERQVNSDVEENDETKRYLNTKKIVIRRLMYFFLPRYDDDQEEAFDRMIRDIEEERLPTQQECSLTDEQKERMLKNRQLAEERRRLKQSQQLESPNGKENHLPNMNDEPPELYLDDEDM